jgi:hypothetical protein
MGGSKHFAVTISWPAARRINFSRQNLKKHFIDMLSCCLINLSYDNDIIKLNKKDISFIKKRPKKSVQKSTNQQRQ